MNLKLVVLSNVSETWMSGKLSSITSEMFSQMAQLKLQGYLSRYSKGTLPLDGSDFFCTHLLLCEEIKGQCIPIMGYKSVTYDDCLLYHSEFPLMAALQDARAENHLKSVQSLMNLNKGKIIRYCSGYTIRPQERSDKVFAQYLKELLVAIHVNFILSSQTDLSLTCGVTTFKADQTFMSWGYEPLQFDGTDLAPYYHVSINGEARALFLKKFNAYALGMAEKHKSLWDSRLEIATSSESKESALIAA